MNGSGVSDDFNPYRSPETARAGNDAGPSGAATKFEELGRLIVTWEKLRFVYNAIGLIPTVFIVLAARPAVFEIAICAFWANLCFCAGPVIDGYLTWFGFRSRVVTVILFVLGTSVMLLLAFGYLVSRTWRWMD